KEIAKFSMRDADNYSRYEAMLERVADVIEPTLTESPPDLLRPGIRGLWRLFRLQRRLRSLRSGAGEAIEILTGPARPILDRWFESEQLKATLATDAIIGAMASPSMPGTAYVLFHHVMGETNGKRGVWGYVRGGMGGLTRALASVARSLGVDIRCDAEGRQIIVEKGRAPGAVLGDGRDWRAWVVASNADANVTFTRLLPPLQLPPDFLDAVRRISYESASLKINVALSELPDFTAYPGGAGPQHRGTIHI